MEAGWLFIVRAKRNNSFDNEKLTVMYVLANVLVISKKLSETKFVLYYKYVCCYSNSVSKVCMGVFVR